MAAPAIQRDTLDRFTSYPSTVEGAGVCFDALSQATRYASYLSLSASQLSTAHKVVSVADTISGSLAWPELITGLNDCRHSFSALQDGLLDPSQADRISSLFKKAAIDGLTSIGMACQGVHTFAENGLISAASALPFLGGGISGTCLIVDSVGMYDAAQELQKDLSAEEKQLQGLKFTKHLARWALSFIGVLSLITQTVVLPFVGLFSSSVYLIMKIFIFMAEQKKKDAQQV
jgi:hypothetical protein